MSKPILSELEYNADDVASAILQQADLSITNEDLGVTNISSNFVIDSAWNSWDSCGAFKFNGFVFLYLNAYYSGSDLSNNRTVFSINDSDFYPSEDTYFVSCSYQGDSASNVALKSTGTVLIDSPLNEGDGNFYMVINGFYRL